jgi:hypothetical protein
MTFVEALSTGKPMRRPCSAGRDWEDDPEWVRLKGEVWQSSYGGPSGVWSEWIGPTRADYLATDWEVPP